MTDLHYYFFLNPIESGLRIADTDIPDMSIEVGNPLSDKKLTVEYFLYPLGEKVISHFRVVFPDITDNELNEKELDVLYSITASVLGALRLAYSPFVTLYPLSFSTTGHIELSLHLPKIHTAQEFSLEHLKNSTICNILSPVDFSLYSDSYGKYYPMTHRYLSLFKIFDKYARNNKKETSELLIKYLSKYVKEYNNLGISRQSIENFAFTVRDKCAHSVVKGGKNGARTFVRKDMAEIESFTDNIMQRAATDLLNDEFLNSSDLSLRRVKLYWSKPSGFNKKDIIQDSTGNIEINRIVGKKISL